MGVERLSHRMRPKEKHVLLPVTSQIDLGSVGRQTFLFIVTFCIEV